jgi:thiaminase/transcriptional activator TenA
MPQESLVAPSATAAGEGGLFRQLKASCPDDWRAYTRHEFVRRLAEGSLPEQCFRHYLGQDYLFLIHFSRAYALAIYKAEGLDDMRRALASLKTILEIEMGLHVGYCSRWGLSEPEMQATPESRATLAYTRFVLERGMSGDLLDLQVALSPCILGYGEIARGLAADPRTRFDGNPFRDWIEMYAGAEYQTAAAAAAEQLDTLFARRGGPGRLPGLAHAFATATRLEADFWQMGLTCAG